MKGEGKESDARYSSVVFETLAFKNPKLFKKRSPFKIRDDGRGKFIGQWNFTDGIFPFPFYGHVLEDTVLLYLARVIVIYNSYITGETIRWKSCSDTLEEIFSKAMTVEWNIIDASSLSFIWNNFNLKKFKHKF